MCKTRTDMKKEIHELHKLNKVKKELDLDYTPAPKKKKHIKGKRLSPYQVKKISHRNIETVDELPDDASASYLNCSWRPLEKYFDEYFKSNKKETDLSGFFFKKLDEAEKNKTMVSVLDCGAGEGNMLNDLLSKYKDHVEGTGISMHHFDKTDTFLMKHKNLKWYCHKAEDVLPTLKAESFDILIDLFGAYFYSADRIFLLQHYHRLLKPGGQAFILNSEYTQNLLHHKETKEDVEGHHKIKKTKEDFESHLVEKYPDCFKWGDDDQSFLVIQKKTMRSPLLNFKVKSIEESIWEYCDPLKNNLDEDKLRRGHAYYPQILTIEKTGSYDLRAKPYCTKLSSSTASTKIKAKL